MTLLQKTYERMKGLSDRELQIVFIMVDKMAGGSPSEAGSGGSDYDEILEMTREAVRKAEMRDDLMDGERAFYEGLKDALDFPVPRDFDYVAAREEGMREKYGDFV